ncbi:hypothetical protein G2W53_027323 [Senna tora]|uniref:Uncharacterized protein n=1 Tax=Senna tora TaxID=362788 RepID=A0A834WIB4_9FABA|nr:hypothetical protein G2W53_027323 [Senna tora]
MDRNTREIDWIDSSDSDLSGEMEEVRNPNNIIDRPPPSPRPTRAPLIYVNHEHVNANRQFWVALLMVFSWEPNLVLGRVLLIEISIWVQLWDIPLEYQTLAVANQIASLMGAVRELLMKERSCGYNSDMSTFIDYAVDVAELVTSVTNVIGPENKWT